jgi:hypothetical protein
LLQVQLGDQQRLLVVVDHVLQEPDVDGIHRRRWFVVALERPDRRAGEQPDDDDGRHRDHHPAEQLVGDVVGDGLYDLAGIDA